MGKKIGYPEYIQSVTKLNQEYEGVSISICICKMHQRYAILMSGNMFLICKLE